MKKALGFVVALAAAASWGAIYALVEQAMEQMSPMAAIIVIYFAGSLLMLPVVPFYLDEISSCLKSADLSPLVLTVLLTVVAELLIFSSIKMLGGTEAGIIEITYPIFTALILYVTLGKSLTASTLIGGALALIGIAVMTIF